MTRSQRAWCSLPAAALLSLACLSARGQPPAADPARLFAEARPHLEAVLGAPLPGVPRFQTATAEQVRQLPDPGLDVALLARFPDLGGADFERARQAARQAKASSTVARYVPGSDVIYVLPGQQPAIAAWDESLGLARSPRFLQLALVQEFVRGELDRRYDLPRRRGACRDPEESLILEALVEGRAQWVTRQVARGLGGTEACFPLLAERLRHVPDVTQDSGLRAMTQTALRQEYWACVHGLEFFTYLEEYGGRDAERRAFTSPPRQLGWLEAPQRYVRSGQRNRPGLDVVLARVQQAVSPPGWSGTKQAWTPGMVCQAAALFGAGERAEAVLQSWDEGRSLLWVAGGPGRQVALSVVRHETAAGARAYHGLAVELQRKRDELSGGETGGALRVLDSRSAALALPGVDEAVRTDRKMQFGGAGRPVVVTALLARAGDLVIELSWYGLEADAAWGERVVGAVLAAAASR